MYTKRHQKHELKQSRKCIFGLVFVYILHNIWVFNASQYLCLTQSLSEGHLLWPQSLLLTETMETQYHDFIDFSKLRSTPSALFCSAPPPFLPQRLILSLGFPSSSTTSQNLHRKRLQDDTIHLCLGPLSHCPCKIKHLCFIAPDDPNYKPCPPRYPSSICPENCCHLTSSQKTHPTPRSPCQLYKYTF